LGIVRLRVADNGVGLLREEQQRIFEPYFSTKSNGTGLGLAIVRRVVEDHNGFVRARSNYPQGTEMIVEIPFVEVQVSTRLRTENSPAVIVREGGVDEA
jgi:two-component system nitrogen regulation sensor histidine kinase NtrY